MNEEIETPTSLPEQSIGAKLKSTREQKGIKLEFVSSHTKIRWLHLKAIESGINYQEATLPSTYYRGYIRTYCQFFGFDSRTHQSEIDALFPLEATPMPPQQEALFQGETQPRNQILSKTLNVLGIALAGLLTIGLFYAFSDNGSKFWPEDPTIPSLSELKNDAVVQIQGKEV